MNKFRVACFQTTSSDIPEENIIMLEKIFSKVKKSHSFCDSVWEKE